jgi:hypothetical protein
MITAKISRDERDGNIKELDGIEERKREQLTSEISDYFDKVFDSNVKFQND